MAIQINEIKERDPKESVIRIAFMLDIKSDEGLEPAVGKCKM
jgi:hypothetical protein